MTSELCLRLCHHCPLAVDFASIGSRKLRAIESNDFCARLTGEDRRMISLRAVYGGLTQWAVLRCMRVLEADLIGTIETTENRLLLFRLKATRYSERTDDVEWL